MSISKGFIFLFQFFAKVERTNLNTLYLDRKAENWGVRYNIPLAADLGSYRVPQLQSSMAIAIVPVEFPDLKDSLPICGPEGCISKCNCTTEYLQMNWPSLSAVDGPILISAHRRKIYGTSERATL